MPVSNSAELGLPKKGKSVVLSEVPAMQKLDNRSRARLRFRRWQVNALRAGA